MGLKIEIAVSQVGAVDDSNMYRGLGLAGGVELPLSSWKRLNELYLEDNEKFKALWSIIEIEDVDNFEDTFNKYELLKNVTDFIEYGKWVFRREFNDTVFQEIDADMDWEEYGDCKYDTSQDTYTEYGFLHYVG